MKAGEWAVAAMAAAVATPSLMNGFVYDDVLVILENPLVHGLSQSGAIWHSSYWPAGLLYRPLTLQLFALEWTAGDGRPLVFHAVSVLLSALLAVLVFRLVHRVLGAAQSPESNPRRVGLASLFGAAVFALHPVHVEAVANVVGQAELLASLFALLAVERYLAWRAVGGLTLARRLLLAAITLCAILSKETGYVVPLLLLAAELLVPRARRDRVAATFLLQGGVVAAALLLRAIVLGSIAGENPAAVFRGLGVLDRAIAMLAVVPEWARLLLWPARLQGEYGPPAIPLSTTFTLTHGLGLLILALVLAAGARTWKRRPVVAFGLLWTFLALTPVSNVLAPSGLVLAERILFLPSVGVALVGAGLLLPVLSSASSQLRVIGVSAGILLLALAGARTLARQPVWRSQETFFGQLERDAPRSYRAHFVASRFYYGARRYGLAERAAQQALALYPLDSQVHEQLGQVLRVQGRCAEALPILEEGVRLSPAGTTLRSRLIECALAVGDTARARNVAEEAVRLGQSEFAGTVARLAPK